MKTITLLFLCIFFCCTGKVWSQHIQYQPFFETALQLASEQQKPLAILFTIQPPVAATHFLQVLQHPEVIEKFNSSFINVRLPREDTTVRKFIVKYRVTRFPSLVFLDSKGGILLNNVLVVAQPARLLAIAEEALNAGKENSLVDMDARYQSGNLDKDFLKSYIDKRKRAGIVNNAIPIEKYIDYLTIADLGNYNEVLFLLQAGPLAESRAYRLAYTNKKVTDSIYRHELFEVRSAINNAIIANSMASAIQHRNFTQAQAVARFTMGTWGINYREGQKNYALKLLQYYRAVKDTQQYLQQAAVFYDQHYMKVSNDSLQKREQESRDKAKGDAMKRAARDTSQKGSTRTISYSFASNTFSTELNNAAWSFYQLGTRDGTYLSKAMLWSKRAIELHPVAGHYDTLAHLLYRLGFYAEAESTQQKAVDLAKKEKREVKEMEMWYQQMKNRTLE